MEVRVLTLMEIQDVIVQLELMENFAKSVTIYRKYLSLIVLWIIYRMYYGPLFAIITIEFDLTCPVKLGT